MLYLQLLLSTAFVHQICLRHAVANSHVGTDTQYKYSSSAHLQHLVELSTGCIGVLLGITAALHYPLGIP